MPPDRHNRSENAMRRIAPGSQSGPAPGGGVDSMLLIDSPRSCTQGAITSPRMRLASSISNSAACGWDCMNEDSLAAICWLPDTFRHGRCGLKMPDLERYGGACGE